MIRRDKSEKKNERKVGRKADARPLRDPNLDNIDIYRDKEKAEEKSKLGSKKTEYVERAGVKGGIHQKALIPNTEVSFSERHVLLRNRFTVAPPFTVFNARSGDWQARKRSWKSIGIKSEIGRGENITMLNQKGLMSLMSEDDKGNRKLQEKDIKTEGFASGTSVFDPVLCEAAYRWYCPENAKVLDPFAGGSVRGVLAAMFHHFYFGIDLSKKQIEANIDQWDEISKKEKLKDIYSPTWVSGDSNQTIDGFGNSEFDFVFSCPPYGDLEKYSNDPLDISNMPYEAFLDSYNSIIKKACDKLKDNRFACFVVGDFRDKNGFMRDFEVDTINAFKEAGLKSYNKHILVTVVGTLPVRVVKQFNKYRKAGMAHQYMYVFYKGENANKNILENFTQDVGREYK